ncbi:MAG TPA: hypothetical protein VGG99_01550 [Acetobacteraceae bacterium]|jgi:hypothetical protein
MQTLIARAKEDAQARLHAGVLRPDALRRVGRDADADDVFSLVVPAQREPLVAMTHERRQRLRRHVASLLRSTAAEASAPGTEVSAPPPSAVVRGACAACQGRCCSHGAERAYLTEATMARVATSDDRPSPRHILRRYMARVPSEAVRGSCIFHGAYGCTLNRSLRSEICNKHYCTALKAYLRDAPAEETRDVLVMAVQDDVLHDACLVNAETTC